MEEDDTENEMGRESVFLEALVRVSLASHRQITSVNEKKEYDMYLNANIRKRKESTSNGLQLQCSLR